MRSAVFALALLAACQRTPDKKITPVENKTAGEGKGSGSGSGISVNIPPKSNVEQVKPPIDIQSPPLDAVKTSSGLIYKKLTSLPDAPAPKRNDTVMINYTGWRQSTGETFFSNKSRGQPMPLQLANTAPGFTEAMQLVRKGEKAMLWLPPDIGYKGTPPDGGTKETLVYEVEVVDIVAAPAVPPDVGVAPASAPKLKTGLAYEIVKPGTGKDKARYFDTVTFNYSAWDKDGRMFDSTEMRKRPATVPPYRQTVAMEEILTAMTAGERVRVWIPSTQMLLGGKPLPGMPEGILTYEIELITIAKGFEPPPVPADVKAAPSDAKKTPKGVAYKVLKAGGGGPHPGPTDVVKLNYTGWTADGRMFDSSVVKGQPAEMALNGVIMGWTDAIGQMSAGDKWRMWIPADLAYKASPGRPQGTLVFEIELLELKPAPKAEKPPELGADPPAPPDVAGPPAGAKKSPKGVSYVVLTAVPNAPHPKPGDTIKTEYAGWTTDGKFFDGSVRHGGPLEISLSRVVDGWKDVFPLIGQGETVRMWVPQELAYPSGGGPQGMLVFDVTLREIKAK